jgi:hypothetical protein
VVNLSQNGRQKGRIGPLTSTRRWMLRSPHSTTATPPARTSAMRALSARRNRILKGSRHAPSPELGTCPPARPRSVSLAVTTESPVVTAAQ